MKKSLIIMLLIASTLFSCTALNDQHQPKQSNVLIIGDSISLAYTPHVIRLLKDKALVKHHKGNAGPSIRGLVRIEGWLGQTKWDIIHFNWGLWDMYGWEYAKDDISPAGYEKRLNTLVIRLKKTGAKLIWATTTPACPEAEVTMKRRFKTTVKITPKVEKQFLDAALRVMKKHQIQINDLHAYIAPDWKKYSIADNNVHFNRKGSIRLAEKVADVIEKRLKNGK